MGFGPEVINEAWDTVFTALLKKKPSIATPSQTRTITSLAITRKVAVLAAISVQPEAFHIEMNQFAFRAEYSCTDFTQLHQLATEKAQEFGMPLYFFIGDIRKAYDHMDHQTLIQCLTRRRIYRSTIGLWIGQLRKTSEIARLSDLESQPFHRQVSVYQGGNEGPLLFNIYFDDGIRDMLKRWKQKGWGLLYSDRDSGMEDVYLALTSFADNFVLYSNNAQDLQEMLDDLITTLAGINWSVSVDSMLYGVISAASKPPMQVDGTTINAMNRDATYTLTGVKFNMSTNTTDMFHHLSLIHI